MPVLEEADDSEAIMEEAVEDFSHQGCHYIEEFMQHACEPSKDDCFFQKKP